MITLKLKFSVPLHRGEGADRVENGEISDNYELQINGEKSLTRDCPRENPGAGM